MIMQESLVIPVYKLKGRTAPLLAACKALLESRPGMEIVLVDDGSGDGTAEELSRNASERLRVLAQPYNRGKGAAVRRGMLDARGKRLIFTDADLPYDLSALDRIAHALEEGADVVLGSRALIRSSEEAPVLATRRLSSAVFSFAANLILRERVEDTQCGLKGFTADAAGDLFADLRTERFCFDVELIYKAQERGYRIALIPVTLRNNEGSTVSLWRDSISMLADLIKLYARIRGEEGARERAGSGTRFLALVGLGLGLLSLPILHNLGADRMLLSAAPTLIAATLLWLALSACVTALLFRYFYLFPLPSRMAREGARYILVGIFNTLVNASVFNILVILSGTASGPSVVYFSALAYVVTIVQAFFWNRYWVFTNGRARSAAPAFASFVGVTLSVALISTGFMHLMINTIGAPASISERVWANIAIALTIPISFAGNFIGNKLFVFRR